MRGARSALGRIFPAVRAYTYCTMENKFVVVKFNRRDILSYILYGFVPAILGAAVGIFADTAGYARLKLPPLAVPASAFSAIWGGLFVLSGWASYLVIRDTRAMNVKKFDRSVVAYFISLAMNYLWPFIFFNLGFHLLAALWLLLYCGVCVYFSLRFFKINKNAGLMTIPQLVWILYCLYLNVAILITSL
ncbi:MAG: tryptophan-rich sensory protein [Clostridiales bacterium]|nr:tryptophan-rich sensory protein [Clostridiales bacterium]